MNDCPEKCMRSLSRRTIAVFCSLPLVLALGCFAQAQSPGPDAKASDGKTLAFDRGKGNCLSCHEIKGGDLPGTIGPQLNDMKSRFPDRNELIGTVTDETRRNPQTIMPPFGRNLILNDKEISAIVDFLYTL
jgi:sulfur-oxidizing protein SoxX